VSVQWFPGHMARAKRELAAFAKKANLLLHVLDARAPQSTFFPEMLPNKKPILVFTKIDLADPKETKKWKEKFSQEGFEVLFPNHLKSNIFWGKMPPSAKVMVVGLPNVGKSTLINKLVGEKKARTGAIPGITRGPQWIKLEKLTKIIYLLDTPGVFYPSHLPQEKGWKLAAIETMPLKNYEGILYEVAEALVRYVQEHYRLFKNLPADFSEFLEVYAKEKMLLLKGGKPNLPLAASRLIADFQKGKWGRITLETPG
jgi:ribosome biogenesis GTPase A